MSVHDLNQAIKSKRSESAERNSVQRELESRGYRKQPKIAQQRLSDGRLVRMYLWRDTPLGHVCLVSGPDVDARVLELFEVDDPSEIGGVYFPASRGAPALSDAAPERRSNPAAPGYASWSWTQEDWRSVKVSPDGTIDYSEKCGAPGTRTASGKPRLCLPHQAIVELMKTKAGRAELASQARRKARAPKGSRVAWSPMVKAAATKVTESSPPDRKRNGEAYPWLRLDTVEAAIPAMVSEGVSEVARSSRGFIQAYRRAGGRAEPLRTMRDPESGQTWWNKRNGFVARHLAQLEAEGGGWEASGEPTRRHLALVAWAYSPDAAGLRQWLQRSNPGHGSAAKRRTPIPVRVRAHDSYDLGTFGDGATRASIEVLEDGSLELVEVTAGPERRTVRREALPFDLTVGFDAINFYITELLGPPDEGVIGGAPPPEPTRPALRAHRAKPRPSAPIDRTAQLRMFNPQGRPPGSFESWEAYNAWKRAGLERAIAATKRSIASTTPERAAMPGGLNAHLETLERKLRRLRNPHRPETAYKRIREALGALPRARGEAIGEELCYPAAEAFYHAVGGKDAGYTPMQLEHEGVSHWFVRGPGGRDYDLTEGQFDSPVPHDQARGRGFLTAAPSKRAVELMQLAAVQRHTNPAGIGDGGTAITRGGPSAPVKYLEAKGLIRSPVLDFGSGRGEDAEWLRSRGYSVREYDPNFEGVSELPSGTYNTVLATYVLNVLPKSEEAKILGQIRARLRPTGRAYVTVRGDVKTAGATSRGYQRPVELPAEVVGRAAGSPIFELEKRQANPRATVGKTRTRKDGSKYVLWRPVLEDGSRPRIYLSADKGSTDAELVDVTEAEQALEAGKRAISRRIAAAKARGKRASFLKGTGRRIVSSTPRQASSSTLERAQPIAPIYDSEGDEYRVEYRVVPSLVDGLGPLLASNLPESFDDTPGYPRVFQARSLQRQGEMRKIRKIATKLDPDRLLLPHSDATFGTPVVWEGDGKSHTIGDSTVLTPPGTFYVLGGNGRTIAVLMAPTDRYQAYVQRGRALWPDIWPSGGSPEGRRNVLVRVVTKADGSPLSFIEARTLAGRTQAAASGEESPIGKALSLIRSLGIERVSELPRFIWKGIITQDNVAEFQDTNPAYAQAVYRSMGEARAESYKQDEALLATLFNNLMVGYLPRRFQSSGFVGEKQERALLAALPIVVSIAQGVESGDVKPKWDLFGVLDAASRFAQAIKRKSDVQAIALVEQAASQTDLTAGLKDAERWKGLFDELPMLGVMLGLVLKKAERARDPAITVERYLQPYAAAAFSQAESSRQFGMFAAKGSADAGQDPVELLASELGVRLPRKVRAPTGGLFGGQRQLVANPRSLFGELRQLTYRGELSPQASQEFQRFVETRGGRGRGYSARADGQYAPYIEELLEKDLIRISQCARRETTVYDRETCMFKLTKRGIEYDEFRKRQRAQELERRQVRLFNAGPRRANRAKAPLVEQFGDLGGLKPGQKGYKSAADYGDAYGGQRPSEVAAMMLRQALDLYDTDELFQAWCREIPEHEGCFGMDLFDEDDLGYELELADLLSVPGIGGDGKPLSEIDRATIALSVVRVAGETISDRGDRMLDVQVGVSKSRKGGERPIFARRGDKGEVPLWAAHATLTDWLTSMVPGGAEPLRLVTVSKDQAAAFIKRHHSALPYINARGLLFALGLMKGDRLVAVATVNTPTGNWSRTSRVRKQEPRQRRDGTWEYPEAPLSIHNITELTRVASDGSTKGAAGKLVSRIIDVLNETRRAPGAGSALLVTYQLDSEQGTTYKGLRDKGLRPVAEVEPDVASGARAGAGDRSLAGVWKIRWECCIDPPAMRPDWSLVKQRQMRLFNPWRDSLFGEARRNPGEPSDRPAAPGMQLGLFGGAAYSSPETGPPGELTVLNMGLGRDSLTMLCLLADGELVWNGKKHGPEDVDAVVFADTGNEWKHTYGLIPRVAAFAKKHGIRWLHLRKPQPGTPTGELMADWQAAMAAARAERQAGWSEVYREQVEPMYRAKDAAVLELRTERNEAVKLARKQAKAKGLSKAQIAARLEAVKEPFNLEIERLKKQAKDAAAKLKAEGGFAFRAERAWWAPKGPERRRQFETIEERAEAGVYHLRPELLADFASKGTIPLRQDKSCTGNHKVAPIRKVTEDLAIERFGPWATNTAWGAEVAAGRRKPHVNLIGLAADETDRLEKGGDIGCFSVRYVTEAYPLAEMGIGKPDEQAYLDACGFGDVRKSGCWLCPFQPLSWWWALSVLDPAKFDQAAAAEIQSTLRDPKLYFIGRKGPDGRPMDLRQAVAAWRAENPDADPAAVLEKQYAKCALKAGTFAEGEPRANPSQLAAAVSPDSCCPECSRFVELWLEFGLPGTLDRQELAPDIRTNPTEIQSLMFARDRYTKRQARSWAAAEGFAAPATDSTANYHRIRQRPPGDFRRGTFRTIELRDGVKAVVGVPKKRR